MTLSPERSPEGAGVPCRSPAPTNVPLYGYKAWLWQYLRCVCDSSRAQLNSLPGRCQGIPCKNAGVAQLVEHELPKLGVAGSNPVARSRFERCRIQKRPDMKEAGYEKGGVAPAFLHFLFLAWRSAGVDSALGHLANQMRPIVRRGVDIAD